MKIKYPKPLSRHKGTVLALSMVFIAIFSILAVSMAAVTSLNVECAENMREGNRAFENALSGLEIVRYHLENVTISSPSQDRLRTLTTNLNDYFSDAHIDNFFPANYDPTTISTTIPTVHLNPENGFTALIIQTGDDTLLVKITGSYRQFTRLVTAQFAFSESAHTVFDYGVATRGPLNMSGQSAITDVNVAVDAGVYIEGNNLIGDAYSINGKASVSDDVIIANPDATYSFGSKSSVGGGTASDPANPIQNHIRVGHNFIEFPAPDPESLRQFATGGVIDANTVIPNDAVLNNVIVKANTNLTFSSSVTINGILFIESPNCVMFSGKATVNALIVASGLLENPLSTDSLKFAGQVTCNGPAGLTDPQFDLIKQQTGTFILAPGFDLSFSGQSMVIDGAIAASGISFTGQAGGTIKGTLLNYDSDPISLAGQGSLRFDSTGANKNPAGFQPVLVVRYDPDSYSESL